MLEYVELVYAANAAAGLLKLCEWQPAGNVAAVSGLVLFAAPGSTLLDSLVATNECEMRYPASRLVGLKAFEEITVAGIRYQVRQLIPVGDGSEVRATLAHL